MESAATAVVLVGTIAALYLRPFGARDWHVAGLGGLAAWLVGPLSLGAGADVIRDSANIVAFFLGLMLVAAAAETAGFYARMADLLRGRSATGAVTVVLVAGVLITVILSNDATPLVLTPAVFVAARARGSSAIPGAFAATFIADGASMVLPVSNPVNILFVERLDISLGDYVAVLAPTGLAAAIALAAAMLVITRREPTMVEATAPARETDPPRHPSFERIALAVLVALTLAYMAAAILHWPLGAVAMTAGIVLLAGALSTRAATLATYRRHVAPGIVIFVLGLMVAVESAVDARLLEWLTTTLEWAGDQPTFVAVLAAACLATALSNVMNNWPAGLVIAAALAAGEAKDAVITGALLGCTVGANFTVVGSLSTVFWLNLARQRGATVTPGQYARRAFIPTAAAMTAGLLAATLLVGLR